MDDYVEFFYKYWPLLIMFMVLSGVAISFYCFLRYLKMDAMAEFDFRKRRLIRKSLCTKMKAEKCPICLDYFARWEKVAESSACKHIFHVRCSGYYVGEADRELEVRVKDHKRCCLAGAGTSAFATHKACKPDFAHVHKDDCMDHVDILGREQHYRLRLLPESAMIQTVGGRNTILVSPNDANINRDSGTLLPTTWLPLLRKQS